MKKRRAALIAASLLIGGCGNWVLWAPYKYAPDTPDDLFAKAEAEIHGSSGARIETVDGDPLSRYGSPPHVRPGKHRLRVAAGWSGRSGWHMKAHAYAEWTFESGKRYQFVAYPRTKTSYDILLMDTTNPKKVQLAAFPADPPRALRSWGRERAATELAAEGTAATALRDKALELAAAFASRYGLVREDSACPYNDYGIMRGNDCVAYVTERAGVWVAVSHSVEDSRSVLVFLEPLRAEVDVPVPEVRKAFDDMIFYPLIDEFGRQVQLVSR